MLTISKPLSASQAQTYHVREFASQEQNYWSRDQQGHSEWQGRLAEQWGLHGGVGSDRWRFPCFCAYGPTDAPSGAGRRRDPRIREPLCPSLVFRAFRATRHANALRQVFFFELQAYGIVLRRGEIAQPVRHAQHKKDRRVYSDRDAGIALFNLDEGRAAD
jgi:hypothetical protein